MFLYQSQVRNLGHIKLLQGALGHPYYNNKNINAIRLKKNQAAIRKIRDVVDIPVATITNFRLSTHCTAKTVLVTIAATVATQVVRLSTGKCELRQRL